MFLSKTKVSINFAGPGGGMDLPGGLDASGGRERFIVTHLKSRLFFLSNL